MSWQDNLKSDLVIYTGAGDIFKPKWQNARVVEEYHTAEFNFRRVPGTLVKREEKLGSKFAMELYFDGPDHLEISEQLRVASKDKRFWVMEHPYYGVITCQPTTLDYDNSGFNVTKITSTFIETIIDEEPLVYGPEFNLPEAINAAKEALDETIVASVIYPLLPGDVNTLRNTNIRNYNLSVPIITLPEEFEIYNNLFNQANTAINTAIASPTQAIRATTSAISQPSRFSVSVKSRINVLGSAFDRLHETAVGLVTVSAKNIYQLQAGSLISSMCVAASSPQDGDYMNSNDVLQIFNLIFAKYSSFVADLDAMQSPNGGNTNSFIPDANIMFGISGIVDTTLAGLFGIALSSKKEQSIITESDTNLIILTHRLYGLASDKNIEELIANNNFGLIHMIQVEKGTKVKYYI